MNASEVTESPTDKLHWHLPRLQTCATQMALSSGIVHVRMHSCRSPRILEEPYVRPTSFPAWVLDTNCRNYDADQAMLLDPYWDEPDCWADELISLTIYHFAETASSDEVAEKALWYLYPLA